MQVLLLNPSIHHHFCKLVAASPSRLVILTDNLYGLLGHFRVGLQEFPLILTSETRPPLFWGAIPKMGSPLTTLPACLPSSYGPGCWNNGNTTPLYWITNVDSVLECTYLSIKMEEVLWNVMWYDWHTHAHAHTSRLNHTLCCSCSGDWSSGAVAVYIAGCFLIVVLQTG